MLAGCSPSDGSTTVVYSTPGPAAQLEECDQTVYLNNNSSQPLTLSAGLSDDNGENGCVDQDQSTDAIVVSPGDSRAVGVSLQCETCGVRAYFSVDSTDPTSPDVLHYDDSLGGGNVYCDDNGCVGH